MFSYFLCLDIYFYKVRAVSYPGTKSSRHNGGLSGQRVLSSLAGNKLSSSIFADYQLVGGSRKSGTENFRSLYSLLTARRWLRTQGACNGWARVRQFIVHTHLWRFTSPLCLPNRLTKSRLLLTRDLVTGIVWRPSWRTKAGHSQSGLVSRDSNGRGTVEKKEWYLEALSKRKVLAVWCCRHCVQLISRQRMGFLSLGTKMESSV